MHENMPSAVEVEYVAGLKALESHLGGAEANVWKLFAGGAVTSKAAKEYYELLSDRYCIDLHMSTAVLAERDPWKLEALKVQHPEVPVIVKECDALATRSGIVHNEKTGRGGCTLPSVFGYDGGIPCTSRTPLSCNSKENADCIQNETEAETAKGWRAFFGGIKIHRPELGAAECVKQLLQPGVPGGKSYGHYMCEKLRELGFWAIVLEMQTFDYGAWIHRLRAWWAFALLSAPSAEVDAFFNTLLNHFKLSDAPFPACRFISFSAEQRAADAAALSIPQWSALGPRSSKGEGGNWKIEHFEAFAAVDLPWPVEDLSGVSTRSYIDFSGCTPRQCEILIYIDHGCVPQHDQEFCDVNPAFNRVMNGCLDLALQPRSDHKGPWKQSSPTQVGSGRMVIRHVVSAGESDLHNGHTHIVRLLEVPEVMRCIGWDDEYWHKDTRGLASGTLEDLDNWCNIAGNSYSIWHYLPWWAALLATYGKFVNEPALTLSAVDATHAEIEELVDSD